MGVRVEVPDTRNAIRLVALDLDGTVVQEDLSIAKSTVEAVGRAREAGLFVVVATGRMFRSALPHAERLGVKEPVIAYNGALIEEASGGRVLLHKAVPLGAALGVARWCRAERLTLNVYLHDDLYVSEANESVRYYEEISGVEAWVVGDLAALLEKAEEAPTKLLVVAAADEDQEGLGTEIERRFGGALHVARSKGRFTEMTHPEATKGRALAWLSAWLGVKREEILAVGDSFNDVEMLEYAGVGAAMASAPQEVRSRADVTVSTVEEAIVRFAL